ncbi:GNAT family N-acetyltransferase [Halobacteria archaeon AArc-dxtr1]|nr:GNAT family N-acetyltransferase [Halobacteria archaeon AArc-dxtr1]
MSIEIETLDPIADADRWNRYVERSPATNPFFRAEALSLQAEDSGTTPHLLAGFKGQEVVGLFPLFEYSRGPVTGVFSPAPFSWSCYLGPAMANIEKLKQRKADRRTKRFLEGCHEWIETELSPIYSKFVAAEFTDVRPFRWNGYNIDPGYTYIVDLAPDADDVLDRFSGDARNNIRNAPEDRYVVEEGTLADVDRIVDQVRARYESQGRSYQMSNYFARSMYETLPEGALRPYVCRIDGEFAGGILVVESETTRYRWQGGVKPDADVDVPVNDVLDWQVMADGIEDGIERYDLVGAGVPNINRYKAKFNPHLEHNYTITSGEFGLNLMIDRYRKMR